MIALASNWKQYYYLHPGVGMFQPRGGISEGLSGEHNGTCWRECGDVR